MAPRHPNLNALRAFDAAARRLNFRLAAEDLHVTQGAVAQQVRRLEADLGVTLFSRKARGLALTIEGRKYHAEIRRGLEIIDDATRAILPAPPRVTISAPPSFASKWLVPRLSAFEAEAAGVDLRVFASEEPADLERDGVDIAIRQGRAPTSSDLECRMIAPLMLVAVCAADDPRTPVAALGELATAPLIQDGHALWDIMLGDARAGRSLRFNQTALAVDAAANGQGVALAPDLIVDDDIVAGRLKALWRGEGVPGQGFHLLRLKGRSESAGADAVAAWILSEAGAVTD